MKDTEQKSNLSELKEWLLENEHRCLTPGYAQGMDLFKVRALPLDVIPQEFQLDVDTIPGLQEDDVPTVYAKSSKGNFAFKVVQNRNTYEGWKWATERMKDCPATNSVRKGVWKVHAAYLGGYFEALVDTYARSLEMEKSIASAFDAIKD